MKTFIICLLGVYAASASGASLTPRDFAYGYPMSLPSEASAYRVPLPLAIYRDTVQVELSDLAVFNGRGEVVPFFVRRVPPQTRSAHPAVYLPLFPLRGAAPTSAAQMRVTVDAPRIYLDWGSPAKAVEGVPGQYLLDARALEEPVAALQLAWATPPGQFSGRLRIESSDDLDTWRTLLAAAPVASLQSSGQELVHSRIELAPSRAKFWRLSWVSGAPSAPIAKVQAEFFPAQDDAPWSSATVHARQEANRPSEYLFDLGGNVPVERIDLELAETNSVIDTELYSRKNSRDAWTRVTRARFYRIRTPQGDERNAPIDVPLNHDRYWLARVPNPGTAVDVALTVAWHPSELVFLARGDPPFLIAYGSSSSTVARTDLAPFIADISVATADLAAPETLGGAERLAAPRSPFVWRRWILWGVLWGALAALGAMAARLLRDTEPVTAD